MEVSSLQGLSSNWLGFLGGGFFGVFFFKVILSMFTNNMKYLNKFHTQNL